MQIQEGAEMIKIISSDNKEFIVEKKIAFMSELIKHLYDVSPETSREIVVPDVNGDILGRVILFCFFFLCSDDSQVHITTIIPCPRLRSL